MRVCVYVCEGEAHTSAVLWETYSNALRGGSGVRRQLVSAQYLVKLLVHPPVRGLGPRSKQEVLPGR